MIILSLLPTKEALRHGLRSVNQADGMAIVVIQETKTLKRYSVSTDIWNTTLKAENGGRYITDVEIPCKEPEHRNS